MNVSLTPELERLVQNRVASGRYGSASEVIRAALRVFEEQEELRRLQREELRGQVTLGLRQLERGDARTFTAAEAARIKARGRKRLPAR
jgi:antitoxin ParD1/3/4